MDIACVLFYSGIVLLTVLLVSLLVYGVARVIQGGDGRSQSAAHEIRRQGWKARRAMDRVADETLRKTR
jgi:hypothetical protein